MGNPEAYTSERNRNFFKQTLRLDYIMLSVLNIESNLNFKKKLDILKSD